ncbi:MAG: MarR family winged helix-turn-helix transcriptional regulator [Thermoleophilia bacterium]
MNRSTTDRDRSELARRATDALDRICGAADRELDRHAGGYGISDAKLAVLEVLCDREERCACLHALGSELRVTRPNVTKLVDGLERGGLVERIPHPGDRRMVQAQVTPEGLALAERAVPGRRELLSRIWDALDDDELARLVALLDAAADRAGVGAP